MDGRTPRERTPTPTPAPELPDTPGDLGLLAAFAGAGAFPLLSALAGQPWETRTLGLAALILLTAGAGLAAALFRHLRARVARRAPPGPP